MQCVLTGGLCFYLCTSIGWKSASRRVTVTNLLSSQFCCWNKVKRNCEMLFRALLSFPWNMPHFCTSMLGHQGQIFVPQQKWELQAQSLFISNIWACVQSPSILFFVFFFFLLSLSLLPSFVFMIFQVKEHCWCCYRSISMDQWTNKEVSI